MVSLSILLFLAADPAAARLEAVGERILAWGRAHNPQMTVGFQPGLQDSEIHALTRTLPFPFPAELRALYRWHNGSKTTGHLHEWGRFLPLEEAITEYRELMALNRQAPGAWTANHFPFSRLTEISSSLL